MKKIIENYGGAILLYLVIFIGIVAINQTFMTKQPNNIQEKEIVAVNH